MGPQNTGLGGSSLGGLLTLIDRAATARNVFGKLAVMSPSLWWDNELALQPRTRVPSTKLPLKIWLDMGTEEGAGLCPARARFARRFRSQRLGRKVIDLQHWEAAGRWSQRIGLGAPAWRQVLKFLFPLRPY